MSAQYQGPAPDRDAAVRVLYSFGHPMGRSGIGTTALQQVRGLAAAGARVTVVCTSLEAALPPNVTVIETMRAAGRRIPHRVVGAGRAAAYHDWRAARLVTALRDDLDVVHVWPGCTLRTARAARLAAVRCLREVPNTHTAHAFAEAAKESEVTGVAPARGYSHAFDPDRLRQEEAEYAAVDYLLVPAEHVRATFLDRGYEPARLLLHQYGYDPERFGPPVPDRRGDGPLTAVFVGRGEPRKGLHYALEAWLASTASRDGRLLICGDFVPGYRERLQPMLDHASVEVRGFVPDIAEVMRRSDVLLFPSVEEGSALVSYEAQACGCIPLVSTEVGARCVDGEQGLVHRPRDVATLTQHLDLLHAEPALRADIRRRVIAHAPELTWTAAGRVLLGRYQQVVDLTRKGDAVA